MLNYGSPSVISDSQHQHHLALAGRTYSPGPAQTYQTRNSGASAWINSPSGSDTKVWDPLGQS